MLPESVRWRQSGAWAAGVTLFAFETAQSVLLLPLLLLWMPSAEVTLWVSLTAGWGLANAAAAAYVQPLVRSVAQRGAEQPPPANWRALLAQADRTGMILLICLQVAFVVVLSGQLGGGSASTCAATALFLLAMGLKLVALNRFVWLNGMGRVGQDKQILVVASATTLCAAILLARSTGALWGLALASLLGAGIAAGLAHRAAAQLGHSAQGAAASWPSSAEMRGLLLLNLCGYLCMATDVLVANRLLPPTQALAYAFCSRALMSTFLVAGMYAQIRFPSWAGSPVPRLRRELWRALSIIALIPAAACLAYGVVRASAWDDKLGLLPWWMFFTLASTTALSCAVAVCGQMSNARGSHAHMLPSSLLAGAAPLLALSLAFIWQAPAFVMGYAAVVAALAWFNARHAFGTLAPSTAP